MFYFYNPWEHEISRGFLIFSGDVKIEHWLEIGESNTE